MQLALSVLKARKVKSGPLARPAPRVTRATPVTWVRRDQRVPMESTELTESTVLTVVMALTGSTELRARRA